MSSDVTKILSSAVFPLSPKSLKLQRSSLPVWRNRIFSAVFTKSHNLTASWTTRVQYISSCYVSIICTSEFFPHRCLNLPRIVFRILDYICFCLLGVRYVYRASHLPWLNSDLGLINLNSWLKMSIPLWSRNSLDPNPYKSNEDDFTVLGYVLNIELTREWSGPTCRNLPWFFFFHCKSTHNKIHPQNSSC
jgi:hypothetical protein